MSTTTQPAETLNGAVTYFSPQKLRPLLDVAKQAGLEVASLLMEYGVTEEAMADPDTRLPRLLGVAIMRHVIRELNDPLLGLHAAERFSLEHLDVLGYLAQQHPSALEALEACVGYARLVGDAYRLTIERENGLVTLTAWVEGYTPQLPELADYLVACGHRGICELVGAAIDPVRVEIARPKPVAVVPYWRYFRAPVIFGVRRSAIVYPEGPLRALRPRSDARLAQLLSQEAQARLMSLTPATSICEKVRARLLAQLEDGPANFAELARGLWMSERTLRRRLEASGCSYRELLNEVRRDLALSLAESGDLRVADLALRLGFTNPTAFARTFRRWTGVNPSRYKRTALVEHRTS
jgi:AraC-like DNA-binding protein